MHRHTSYHCARGSIYQVLAACEPSPWVTRQWADTPRGLLRMLDVGRIADG